MPTIEPEDRWDAPWRVRARKQDAADLSLKERLAEIERREKELEQRAAREEALGAPPTAEEAETLDRQRTSAWFRKNLGRDDLDTLAGIENSAFTSALRNIPAMGWPDGKDDAAHLRTLRTAVPEPDFIIEPVPNQRSSLHDFL